jgi:tellurite resistance protein
MNDQLTVSEPHAAIKSPGRLVGIVANTPASYFGRVLGLTGLGNTWRSAEQVRHLPNVIAEIIYAVAGFVWAVLFVLYGLKALLQPAKLAAEAAHPVQCCFIGLAGVSTMLIAGGLVPHWREGAYVLFGVGFTFTLSFGIWRTGELWRGERDHGATTAVLYLPIGSDGRWSESGDNWSSR